MKMMDFFLAGYALDDVQYFSEIELDLDVENAINISSVPLNMDV